MELSGKYARIILAVFKWLLTGLLIGVMGGLVGAVFHKGLDFVTELRESNPILILFLPLGAVLIAYLYKTSASKGNIDIKRIFQSVKEEGDIPLVMMPLIFAGTLVTHLVGGSAGREGAALQLGGSMGYNLSKALKFDKKSIRFFVTAGMSSVFSALFGTPLAATIFSLEVTRMGIFNYRGLLLGLISSCVAFLISRGLKVEAVRFNMPEILSVQRDVILKIFILAVLCALVCIVFSLCISKLRLFAVKFISNNYIRGILGGLLLVLMTIAVGDTRYNGAGTDIIEQAVSGNAEYYDFFLKIVFTAVTLASGFKGGEIVPTFFIGATFGCCMGTALGLDGGFCASLGFIALFSGMTKCPFASFLLAIEVFGGKALPFFALASVVSFTFSGNFGLYGIKRKSLKEIFNKKAS